MGEFSCSFSDPPAQRLTTLVSHSEANPKKNWMRDEQACLCLHVDDLRKCEHFFCLQFWFDVHRISTNSPIFAKLPSDSRLIASTTCFLCNLILHCWWYYYHHDDFINQKRELTLPLIYGHPPWRLLLKHKLFSDAIKHHHRQPWKRSIIFLHFHKFLRLVMINLAEWSCMDSLNFLWMYTYKYTRPSVMEVSP